MRVIRLLYIVFHFNLKLLTFLMALSSNSNAFLSNDLKIKKAKVSWRVELLKKYLHLIRISQVFRYLSKKKERFSNDVVGNLGQAELVYALAATLR